MEACTHGGFVFGTHIPDKSWRPSKQQRLAALPLDRQKNAKVSKEDFPLTTFPAPQVLPGDALDAGSSEVEADAQSFQEWWSLVKSYSFAKKRRTIYVVPPPTISDSVKELNSWKVSKLRKNERGEVAATPTVEKVIRYMQAFFSPLPVQQLPALEFTEWASSSRSRPSKKRKANGKTAPTSRVPDVGLVDHTTSSITRIESRPGKKQPFARQLSTNDVADALIPLVPEDAYAVVMLLEHDLFEDEDDDFIIGRAFGGDRISVVSMARYNTYLDKVENVPTDHCWPLNYCADFVKNQGLKVPKSAIVKFDPKATVVQAPVLAALKYELEHKSADPDKTWLYRVCRTTVHEVLHCFGVDHCTYYGCIMQTTAHAAEDARQPSYLCPVDLAKLLRTTGSGEEEWCHEMAKACLEIGPESGFGTLAAWMLARAAELQ